MPTDAELLRHQAGEPYRAADFYLTAAQSAQAVTLSLPGFIREVKAERQPQPYYASPDKPVWKVSELAIAAAARHGAVPAGLMRHLPVDHHGEPVQPPEMRRMVEYHAARRGGFVAGLPLELRGPERTSRKQP